ncbi:MAG: 2-oxoisovalerate dehydrogenase [Ignavibacteria bacterium]|nr:2-oxoisovalerate dehydrogenase [Ignavibacteria bacterium]
MKTEIIFIVQESLDGGFEARALGDSIFTEAENLEELKKNIKEAVACHFEEGEMPKIIRLHYIKEEVIAA